MIRYRVDQIVNGKTYEGGRTFVHKHVAEEYAKESTEADKVTGDCQISYFVTPIKVK